MPTREKCYLLPELSRRSCTSPPLSLKRPAPIPGLINSHQVDNVVAAIKERRELDSKEQTELEGFGEHMWANLRPRYRWLRDWEYV